LRKRKDLKSSAMRARKKTKREKKKRGSKGKTAARGMKWYNTRTRMESSHGLGKRTPAEWTTQI